MFYCFLMVFCIVGGVLRVSYGSVRLCFLYNMDDKSRVHLVFKILVSRCNVLCYGLQCWFDLSVSGFGVEY